MHGRKYTHSCCHRQSKKKARIYVSCTCNFDGTAGRHGIGRQFATAKEAIETFRAETGVIDQDLPAFVIAENGKPVGKMEDGDSVILFNFRGDRAQEISMAFDGDSSFDKFDRGEMPKVK